MANLKLNNVVVVTESAGAATVQSGIFKAADGTAAFTIANSTGVLSLSAALDALTITGDLTVNGTTTTINSTTLSVDDKNIEMGSVASPSDTTADGGGLTLKGATDKTISWVNATDAWTFNQHIFPSADDTYDLGSASKQFRNIYTGDLHLKNERGSWTVIEEENYLTLRNNKTDKVYKLVMEEIE